MRARGPFPLPARFHSLGWGVFFGIPCPCPRSGPRPTHTPDGSPLKIRGNKQGPSRECVRVGPRQGQGRDYPKQTTPAPCKGGVCGVKTCPSPPRDKHYALAGHHNNPIRHHTISRGYPPHLHGSRKPTCTNPRVPL